MDALSNLIDLARIHGSLDLRCQMAGRFALPHEPFPPGEAPFHLVLAGGALLKLPDGTQRTLSAGDFVLLPRGAAHTLQGLGQDEAKTPVMDDSGPLPARRNIEGVAEMDLLCGRFTYAHGAADLVMSALPEVLHVSLTEAGSLETLDSLVAILRNEVRHLQQGALAIVTALSHVLFVMALRLYAQRGGLPSSLLALLTDHRLSSVVLAMIKAPERAWTIELLAQHANMSRATFARHFASKGTLSPMDLLAALRVQHACGLLENGKLPLAEVAASVGYQSEAAFTKVFRKHLGMTPFAYRRGRDRASA